MIEDWRRVFRDGFLAVATPDALRRLRGLLEADSWRLVQRHTAHDASGRAGQAAFDSPCAGACLISQLSWRDGQTVYQVHRNFNLDCDAIDRELWRRKAMLTADPDCPLTHGSIVAWFDSVPRDEMRRELLAEVLLALEGKP